MSTSGQSSLEFQSLANSKLSIFNVSMRKNDRPSFDTALSAQVRPRSQFPAADCLVVEAVPQSVLPLPNERHRKIDSVNWRWSWVLPDGILLFGKGPPSEGQKEASRLEKAADDFLFPQLFSPGFGRPDRCNFPCSWMH